MISGFEPIIPNTPKVLIVGSIPSITSLEKQEYYGFTHNRFWRIMSQFFNCDFACYEEKVSCMKQNHIVLWDVIHSCEREGSLDSKIKNVEVNDLESLLKKYPTIRVVLCNGKKSYELYQKHFLHLSIHCLCMPSTSNANRSISEETLFAEWTKALQKYLPF